MVRAQFKFCESNPPVLVRTTPATWFVRARVESLLFVPNICKLPLSLIVSVEASTFTTKVFAEAIAFLLFF